MSNDSPSSPRPVLVIIGPSAGGKSAAVRELDRRRILRVHPTWTTRPRRPDEEAGALEHRFVDDATFDRLDAEAFFLGVVSLPGLPFRYALPRPVLATAGPVDAIMARAPFVELLADFVPHLLVYQVEDTVERARARLHTRGTAAPEIEARLAGHDAEIDAGRAIAHRVFTNDGTLERLVTKIATALGADEPASVRS